MADDSVDPLHQFARGDEAMAAHLRKALEVLREQSQDPDFRRLATGVMEGRQSMHALAQSSAFNAAVADAAPRLDAWWSSLSEEEKREAAGRLGDESSRT